MFSLPCESREVYKMEYVVTWGDLITGCSFLLNFIGVLFGILSYFKNDKK